MIECECEDKELLREGITLAEDLQVVPRLRFVGGPLSELAVLRDEERCDFEDSRRVVFLTLVDGFQTG